MDRQLTWHPDSHNYTQLKFCTVTIFCFLYNLYRDAAPVPFSNFIYRERVPATYQPFTATAPARNQICIMRSKKRAVAGLHRDNFPAKVPGLVPG
jgi:hypothetical protein